MLEKKGRVGRKEGGRKEGRPTGQPRDVAQ
jgi:hypothetical protein